MSVSAKNRQHTEHDDLLGLDPVPIEPNTSPEYFALECDRVFRRSWLQVGRVDQLPDKGSYFVQEIPNVQASVIVMRDKDDEVRAFHNVCVHRGNRLIREQRGKGQRLVCDYHGWTYDNSGQLGGVPDQDQFPLLDKSCMGLKSISLTIWNGFIFVNLSPEPKETLKESLDGLYDAFADFPFDETVLAGRYAARVKANWKVCMDIGAEAYHVRYVHKASAPDSHVSDNNPLAHLPSIRLFGRHRATSLCANPEHQPTPAEAVVARHAATVLQSATDQAMPSCLNPGQTENWGFDTNIMFPNFALLMGPSWFVTHLYLPVTVTETIWETSLHTLVPSSFGERLSQEFSAIFTRDLIREDWAQVENVQKGLATGALSHMQLSDQEVMVRHAYKVIDDSVRTP